jgi:hypothetical protein
MSKGRESDPELEAVALKAVAYTLNLCHDLGVNPRLKHNTVLTDVGYVLATDDGWVVRTLAYLPLDAGTD